MKFPITDCVKDYAGDTITIIVTDGFQFEKCHKNSKKNKIVKQQKNLIQASLREIIIS